MPATLVPNPSRAAANAAAKLNLVSIEKDGTVRLATTGDVTVADIHPLGRNPFAALLGDAWAGSRVVLDLGKTRFMDSAAVGWLIGSQREFKANGGALAVHSVEPSVRRVLDLLRIDKVVPLHADEAAARQHVAPRA